MFLSKQIKMISVIFCGMLLFCLLPISTSAQTGNLQQQIIDEQLAAAAGGAGAGQPQDPRVILASVIQVFLTILGTLFLVLLVMSGYWLVTARGDESKVEKAQSTIRSAIIGLAIVILAYGITLFATSRIFVSSQPIESGDPATGPRLRFRDL